MRCNGSICIDNMPFTKIGDVCAISFDDVKIPNYMSNVRIANPEADELTLECDVDADMLKKIAGIDLARESDMSCSMELAAPYQVQKRRHKKKRINKKWAKRYGYKTNFKSVKIRDVAFIPQGYGYFDVTGVYESMKGARK